MPQTFLYGSLIQSGSIPTTALGGGVVSSSAQLPSGLLSSSAQLPSGLLSSSAQLPAGIISSSTQVVTSLVGQAITATSVSGSLGSFVANVSASSFSASSNITAFGTISGSSGSFLGNVVIGPLFPPSASLHISGSAMIQQIIERVNVTGSAPPSTLNFDTTSGSILYRSASTANAWTLNFRGDVNTTLNSIMYNNQSLTLALFVFHGATPYSASAYQVDGVSVTPRWLNGLVPTASANSTDIYSFTILKIASASYNVFGSQVRYA